MGILSSAAVCISLRFLLGLFLDFRLYRSQTAPAAARTMITTATGAITSVATACASCCEEEELEDVVVSKNLNPIVVVGEERADVA